jgi:hypothetical protein
VETGEIDRSSEASRSSADDQAIEYVFAHPLPNGLLHQQFPISAGS